MIKQYQHNKTIICAGIDCPDHSDPKKRTGRGQIEGHYCYLAVPTDSSQWEHWILGGHEEMDGCSNYIDIVYLG